MGSVVQVESEVDNERLQHTHRPGGNATGSVLEIVEMQVGRLGVLQDLRTVSQSKKSK